MRVIISMLFIFLGLFVCAQDQPFILDLRVIDGETIFLSDIPEVEILSFKSSDERKEYFLLKRKVLKVYPFALLAKDKLLLFENGLDTISKRRHKRKYIKRQAKLVKKQYSDELKKLTMSEGRILVKLIYRETNTSSYNILKHYRGRFNAFFWQTMAIFWKNNLKAEYDPINIREDILIEHIINQENLKRDN